MFRINPDKKVVLLKIDPTAYPPKPMVPYLMLDLRDGTVDIELFFSSEGIPDNVWRGVVRRYPIPHSADPEVLVRAINEGEFDEFFAGIFANSTVERKGYELRGTLTDEGFEFEEALVSALEKYADPEGIRTVWIAEEWLRDVCPIEEYGITPKTSDAKIKQIADGIEENARLDGAIVVGTASYLAYLRDNLDPTI